MTKRSAIFIAILTLFASGHAAAAEAPDRVKQFEAALTGGMVYNEGDRDNTGYLGMGLNYGVLEWLAIGIEGQWQESDTNAPNEEVIGTGAILADFIFRAPQLHDSIIPYGVLGLGYAHTYATNENGSGQNQGDDDSAGAFAWKVGIGMDWFFYEKWALNLELAYNGSDPGLETASTNDSDYWTLGGGLKYVI